MPFDKRHGDARGAQTWLSRGSNVAPLPYPSPPLSSPRVVKIITPGLLGAMSLGLELEAMLIHLQIAPPSTRFPGLST